MQPNLTHRFCVAPMMDWTDRHCRAFHRTLSRRARLYTEMVTAQAVLHGDRDRLLAFDPIEQPLALQLGGSDPAQLAEAARIGEGYGYDEVNLNVGCPSDRVQSGRFGACLMLEPDLVAKCMAAITSAVRIPATVKCRIGVDDQDPQESLFTLVDRCSEAGVRVFIVHARKAWLSGLSPKDNRQIPPLDYRLVEMLKRERPDLTIVLNGGIDNLESAQDHLTWADGVMLGRAAYRHPGLLGRVDEQLFGDGGQIQEREAVERYRRYVAARLDSGVPLSAMTRHLLGLFGGARGARTFRRILTTGAVQPGAGLAILDEALNAVETASGFGAEGRALAEVHRSCVQA